MLNRARKFFDWLSEKMGYKDKGDWYNVAREDITSNGGAAFISLQSPATVLKNVYPEHNWMLWKSKYLDPLEKKQSIQGFFHWLGSRLGHKRLEDWYNLKWDDLFLNGGLLNYYNNSPLDALQSVFHEHQFDLQLFSLRKSFWERIDNKRSYYNCLANHLGLQNMDDWYNLSDKDIIHFSGQGSLNYISLSVDLPIVYPKHNWMIWKFKSIPKGFWKRIINGENERKEMLNWLGEQLSVKSLEDWYRVSLKEIQQWANIETSELLSQLLQLTFPQHKWDLSKFGKSNKSSQRAVVLAVQQLFPKYRTSFSHLLLTYQRFTRIFGNTPS